jgi:ABC-type antimicrobial peptide transport system permease subunit
MWRYIVRRLMWVAIVVLIITMITFLIFFAESRSYHGLHCTRWGESLGRHKSIG